MDITELLRTSSLYRRLSVDDRARIAAVMSTRSYEKGDVIFREGDPSGRPRRCCCRAVSSSRCSSSSRRACAAVEGLTQRLIELTARLGELSGGRVETRLARLLLKLADTSGRSERGGIFIPLALSRHELADMTGTIESCIRVMSRWGKQEVVRTERDGVVVVDRPALEEAAAA